MCSGETFPYLLSKICSRAFCIKSVIHHWFSRALWCEQAEDFSIAPSLRGSISGRGTLALPRMVQVFLSTNIPLPHSLLSPIQMASSLTFPATFYVDQKCYPGIKKKVFFCQFFISSGFTQGDNNSVYHCYAERLKYPVKKKN